MSKSRLARGPLIGGALFAALAVGSRTLNTYAPDLTVSDFRLADYSDLAALGFAGLALIMLALTLLGSRKGKAEKLESNAFSENANTVTSTDLFDTDIEVGQPKQPEPRVKLTAEQKKAAKQEAAAEKERIKRDAKFQAEARKDAARASRRARRGKAPQYQEILSEDRGTGWARIYDEPTSPSTESPSDRNTNVAEQSPDWLTATYEDPDFIVPFSSSINQLDPASEPDPIIEQEVIVLTDLEPTDQSSDDTEYDLPEQDTENENQVPASDTETELRSQLATMRARLDVLEARAVAQAQITATVNQLQYLHTLRDMVKDTLPEMTATLDRIIISTVSELPPHPDVKPRAK